METEFVLSLGEQRWTLPAEADTITIGRASNADIRLQADDQISRIHARLTRDGATWTLHDESRNGTGLNGHRITAPTALSTGDRIHIGRSVLTFHKSTIPDPITPAPPPPDDAHAADPQPSAYPADSQPSPYPADPQPSAYTDGGEASAYTDGGEASAYSDGGEASAYSDRGEASAYAAGGAPGEVRAVAPPPAAPALPPAASSGPAATAGSGAAGAASSGQAPAQYTPAESGAGYASEPAPGASGHGGFTPEEAPAPPAPAGPAPGGAFPPAEEPWSDDEAAGGREQYGEPEYRAGAAPAGGEQYGEPEYRGEEEFGAGDGVSYEAAGYGAAGVVPGFEVEDGAGRAGDGGWAAYPSADNPEPVRSPWEISARVEQAEPGRAQTERRLPGADRRTGADRRADADRRTNAERLLDADRRTAGFEGDAVGTVRLPRVLIVAAGIIVLGLVVNLIVTFLADGPGGELRWLVPPGIALVVAMVLALLDAAAPKDHRPGRFDVSILVAIAVVLVAVGVGGFALTAGTEYLGGYLTGNESGEDRLVKPVAKPSAATTITVENVTYTSHFTRVEVMLTNGAKEPITIPIAGATFTAADGTALRADTRRSNWPAKVAAGATEHGTITFNGKLPDSADSAVLTLKSGGTAFTISVALSN